MATPHPTEVFFAEEDLILRVTFNDDVVREYPTPFLRGFCPCARCQGHGGGLPTWTPYSGAAAVQIANVTPVGSYAMCIVWGDGHDTGLYSFEMPRRMDPSGFDVDQMTTENELTLHD